MFEKEAEEYANRCACLMEDIPIIERAYQKGAEFGYNKAKEEMQAQLAISEHDREHNDYELAEVYKKVKELEKENAELKDFINAPLTKGRTTTRKEMFQSIWELSKKLTAAKDLLKRWVDDRVYTVSEQKDLIADTEQFLEEE